MLLIGFPARAFATNCYVLAADRGSECVVVDPGIGVMDPLEAIFAEYSLRPAAVLLTHGHLDHTFSVAPVCGAQGIPAYLHPDDDTMLADPMSGLSKQSQQMFGDRLEWTEPDDVMPLIDGARLELVGLSITVHHAPGHTRGSVMFGIEAVGQVVSVAGSASGQLPDPLAPGCLTGDVLFAGSIGRVDLPGGSGRAMMASLASQVLPMPDRTVVIPGHGPSSTIAVERATNPYLQQAANMAAAGMNLPRKGL